MKLAAHHHDRKISDERKAIRRMPTPPQSLQRWVAAESRSQPRKFGVIRGLAPISADFLKREDSVPAKSTR